MRLFSLPSLITISLEPNTIILLAPAPCSSLDETATHILLRLTPSLRPIGTIRASKGSSYYKLSRLAVLRDYRKYRLGRELVLALHEWVKQDAARAGITSGAVKIRCHSQIYIKGFYAK